MIMVESMNFVEEMSFRNRNDMLGFYEKLMYNDKESKNSDF